MKNHIATLVRVITSEGVAAALNRAIDGLAEKRRLGKFTKISLTELKRSSNVNQPPVINLSMLPPHPNRGGSQLQMLDRLREEKLRRTVALLYPVSGAWRLEVTTRDHAWILQTPDTGLAQAVTWAREAVNTTTVHIENLAGVALDQVPDLGEGGRLILSVHDFTGYCRRPHLMEQPFSVFCNYSSDQTRCRNCLGHDWRLPPGAAEAHRQLGGLAMLAADRIVFPSRFLQQRYRELFSDLDLISRSRVIEPATDAVVTKTKASHRPHIAFIGGIKSHKGGAVVIETASLLRAARPKLSLTSYGDGDFDLLQELKGTARVRVRGYYRSGALPTLLDRDQVDIAILPSIWPESYGLVVDECLRAGVPVIAFDIGAVGPRLKNLEAGQVVEIEKGAAGLAAAATRLLDKNMVIDDKIIERLPTTVTVAEQYLELYRELETRKDP